MLPSGKCERINGMSNQDIRGGEICGFKFVFRKKINCLFFYYIH